MPKALFGYMELKAGHLKEYLISLSVFFSGNLPRIYQDSSSFVRNYAATGSGSGQVPSPLSTSPDEHDLPTCLPIGRPVFHGATVPDMFMEYAFSL